MSDRPPKRPVLHYAAPVGSIDLATHDDDGMPVAIWPCGECLPWHLEVIIGEGGEVFAREWHAIECPAFVALIDGD